MSSYLHIYIYILYVATWNPADPILEHLTHNMEDLTSKNGNLRSRYVCIYKYISIYICPQKK